MVPSPVGDKLLSQWAERVSCCSWNKKLLNTISCMLFKAQPDALFVLKPRLYHHMQWSKECSLHSSPYYSTNSSINCCFHSITVKWKSPRYKWGTRAESDQDLLHLDSHLKVTAWLFRVLDFGAYQTLWSLASSCFTYYSDGSFPAS